MLKNIDLYDNYSKTKSESIYRSKHDETKGTGLKILTPKQRLQRIPTALAQVKACSNSKSLLNEVRQIVLFFVSVKTNHQESIQQHNQIYPIIKWIQYL